jgi:hypothetical protein
MEILFAFIGLFLGLYYGKGDSAPFFVLLTLLATASLLLSLAKGRWRFFLPSFFVGLLLCFLPIASSSFSGEKTLLIYRTGDSYFLARDLFSQSRLRSWGHHQGERKRQNACPHQLRIALRFQ